MINECLNGSMSTTLVRQIVALSKHVEMTRFQYGRREGNSVADWLAKSCASNDSTLRIIDIPELNTCTLLFKDTMSMTIV